MDRLNRDEQIRALALQAATRYWDRRNYADPNHVLVERAKQFEKYLRGE